MNNLKDFCDTLLNVVIFFSCQERDVKIDATIACMSVCMKDGPKTVGL